MTISNQEYYQKNKQYILDRQKIYNEKNKEKLVEYQRKYFKDNKTYLYEYRCFKNNPSRQLWYKIEYQKQKYNIPIRLTSCLGQVVDSICVRF